MVIVRVERAASILLNDVPLTVVVQAVCVLQSSLKVPPSKWLVEICIQLFRLSDLEVALSMEGSLLVLKVPGVVDVVVVVELATADGSGGLAIAVESAMLLAIVVVVVTSN